MPSAPIDQLSIALDAAERILLAVRAMPGIGPDFLSAYRDSAASSRHSG